MNGEEFLEQIRNHDVPAGVYLVRTAQGWEYHRVGLTDDEYQEALDLVQDDQTERFDRFDLWFCTALGAAAMVAVFGLARIFGG